MQPTIKQFASIAPLAHEVIARRAVSSALREEIDGYKAKILASHEWMSEALEGNARCPEGIPSKRITDVSEDWLMAEEDFAKYDALLQAMTAAAGHVVPKDYCPALMAESDTRDAERAVLEAAAPMFGLTAGQVTATWSTGPSSSSWL